MSATSIRSAGPSPNVRSLPSGQPRDERSLVQAGERAREHADGHALEYAAARGRNRPERALDRAHRFTDPSPGTNGGLRWKGTRFSQRRSACQWMSAVTCTGMSG